MAELSVKMKLDSTQFEKGVEDAKKELRQFEAEAQKSGKAIEEMGTASVDGAKVMREYMKSIKTLKGELLQLEEGTEEYTKKLQELADKQFAIKDLNETVSMSANDLGEKFANITGIIGGLVGGFNIVQGALALFGAESEDVQKIMMKLQASIAIVQGAEALEGLGKRINALTQQFPALGKAIKTCMNFLKANPWFALATAIAGVVVYLASQTKATKQLTAEQRRAVVQAQAVKSANEAIKTAQTEASSSAGALIGKYMLLKEKYEALGDSFSTKQKFLNENANAFNELGVKVRTVKEMEDLLINNTDEFVKAIQLRAQATAFEQQYVKAYQEYIEETTANKQNAKYKKAKVGDKLSASEMKLLGKDYSYEWSNDYVNGLTKRVVVPKIETQEEADRINAQRNKKGYEDLQTKQSEALTRLNTKTKTITDTFEKTTSELATNKYGKEVKNDTGGNGITVTTTDELQKLIREVVKTGDRTAYNEQYKKESKNEIGSAGYYNDMLSQLNTYKNSTSDTELIATINELIATLKGEQASLQESVFKAEHPNAPEQPVYNAEVQLSQIVQADMKELAEEEKPKLKLDTEAMDAYKKQVAEQQENQVKQMRTFGQQAQAIGGQIQNIFGSIAQCTDDATGAWLNYVGNIIGNASQLISAIMAVTAAQSASSAAQTPIVGWLLVAGAIASTIAAFSAIPAFNDGGVVGGIYKSGDRVLARVNSGEMILTTHQQTRLFALLNGEATTAQRQASEVQFRISGKNLVGVLNNYNNKVSKVI